MRRRSTPAGRTCWASQPDPRSVQDRVGRLQVDCAGALRNVAGSLDGCSATLARASRSRWPSRGTCRSWLLTTSSGCNRSSRTCFQTPSSSRRPAASNGPSSLNRRLGVQRRCPALRAAGIEAACRTRDRIPPEKHELISRPSTADTSTSRTFGGTGLGSPSAGSLRAPGARSRCAARLD